MFSAGKIGLEVEQAYAERSVKPEVLLDMLYTGAITKVYDNGVPPGPQFAFNQIYKVIVILYASR